MHNIYMYNVNEKINVHFPVFLKNIKVESFTCQISFIHNGK